MNMQQTAKDISDFLNLPLNQTIERLKKGFHFNHHEVAKDFIEANTDVNNPNSLLSWYKKTDAYIWELSAYHLEVGFNYLGMCEGISLGLLNCGKKNVLNLGDGIGTLSMKMAEHGLSPTYHDLKNSKTADFAQFRFKRADISNNYNIKTFFTDSFDPSLGLDCFDAVVALDFLEHVVNVDEWAVSIFKCLKKDGVFIAQNAFGIGDIEHGNSIPMHLAVNNKYETQWPTLLRNIGFLLHENGQWWIRP